MADIRAKRIGYDVDLVEGDNVKILINDNERFNYTIGVGYLGRLGLNFQETKEQPE